ncbi:amidase signature enzyme [Coniophora puteana RWD-64-598 SS2]|uniref:amidase n=1 Tax=Coniophora puteana (strain RWD-64-598) TaxID=741705 RepID=A0A5M3MDE8_CONPW|nr:amidase signature enzyme [Coniophora puteana RWD-64-598 SS2]EIW77248.1 amidase signature enzyme [Coniophora puteana RWD-64-598 SS2]
MFSYLAHRRACREKQQQRTKAIADLPPAFHEPLTPADIHILSQPVSAIVARVQTSDLAPHTVFLAYAKKALQAHAQTNCFTEILIGRAEDWSRSATRSGPLAGMPVSIKDMVSVRGWDATIGYSAYAHRPASQDAALFRLLRDAGAVPFVKTNMPTTALSFEASNDVFGRTENPHKKGYGPGGSSGGESALLALGGSRLGIGTDVAGSVRAPAHYAGVYTIKSSMHRFLKTGGVSTMPGQEGVPATYSPMTKTLEDLETFWRAVFQMKPWEYDHSVLNIPWREIKLPVDRPLRFGVMWDDGVVTPSPACLRALKTVTSVLEKYGHQIVTLNPPSPYEGLKLASQLLLADGGRTTSAPFRTGESNDPGMVPAFRALRLPRVVMRLYAAFYRYIMRDAVYAGLIETFYEKTVQEYYALIAARESYRAAWFKVWRGVQVETGAGGVGGEGEGVDFVLTVPNALPALPHGGMRHGWKASGYTFLFNLLDYTAGVLPITHVRASEDALSPKFRARNAIERNYYKYYDARAMSGLPVGVQVVGRRLEEERVLEGMKLIEGLLRKEGLAYEGIPL